MATKSQSGPETLGELFDGFWFEVPEYQRYYSWTEEQLEDLWTDLKTLPEGKDHFFGTIILQETDPSENHTPDRRFADEQRKHHIIDGQQRVTTVSILLNCMLAAMEESATLLDHSPDLDDTLDDIERTWLVDEELYRLELQGGDSEFYQQYVVEDKEFREPNTPSEAKIKRAKSYFQGQFAAWRSELSADEFVDACATLRRQIAGFELMVHYVGDDDDEKATRIFESENDRGKALSMLERTKSFLMYMTYRATDDGDGFRRTIQNIQSSFSNIYDHMQSIEGAHWDSRSEDTIQRYHFVSYFDWGTRKEYQGDTMLDSIKQRVRERYNDDSAACLTFIEDYTESLELAFKHLKQLLTYREGDAIHGQLHRIYTLGNVARFYPLLIHAWAAYEDTGDEAALLGLLDILETAIVRLYAIGGHPSHAKRPRFHRIARDTSPKTDVDNWRRLLSDPVADFKDDGSFRRKLTSPDFYSDQQSTEIRYLLYFYEAQLQRDAGEEEVTSFATAMSNSYEVEHVWPQTPATYPIDQEDYEAVTHRLGNLTLVSDEYNKGELQNKLFDEKRPAFASSSYRLNRDKIADYDEWGPDAIEQREGAELVPFILNRWALEPES